MLALPIAWLERILLAFLAPTNVRSIDKAEEIQDGNCRDDHQINLESQASLCTRIEQNDRSSISSIVSNQSQSVLVAEILVCGSTATLSSLVKRIFVLDILNSLLFILRMCSRHIVELSCQMSE